MRAGRALVVASVAVIALVAGVIAAACSQRGPASRETETPAKILLVSATGGGGAPRSTATGELSPVVNVEVVWRDAERQRGLGGRSALGEDEGMLFVYRDDRPRAFWMKDCLIGLDIAYLDSSGVVVKLATLPPGAGAAPGEIPQAPSVKPCRYVLEVRAGWFSRRGLGEGTVVDLARVTAGLVPE